MVPSYKSSTAGFGPAGGWAVQPGITNLNLIKKV